jgi:hypothetical protein
VFAIVNISDLLPVLYFLGGALYSPIGDIKLIALVVRYLGAVLERRYALFALSRCCFHQTIGIAMRLRTIRTAIVHPTTTPVCASPCIGVFKAFINVGEEARGVMDERLVVEATAKAGTWRISGVVVVVIVELLITFLLEMFAAAILG